LKNLQLDYNREIILHLRAGFLKVAKGKKKIFNIP